ncbi:adenosylcobinamide-GDP ribazoletransferase [Clostridium perfringens]|uniref:adenosylcobinamide-GDP ribazoletransferase n=1 Tax=Clostridium perfringens TaxID=1502 RepID=UPI000D94F69C|nr:adenosylcobinamide-GDP ribazoletransferase [Clostridium perfringens]EJT5925068.1 adenosylcobinamide-GDP ribazoletransferase [Clostridium perfringens]MBP2861081.1 adenosylcobinamide-GDP ribazoletransferase [Clostridium perfringens]MDH5060087.1 Cobalamin synthase [Clostridium perfringens NCTC 8239]UBK61810.1 adenosylcobinamide-GDP ribazoletransferase [Clostridium perfringens]CAG9342741.1 cobalamin synthase [Clostridium perfringens NCTC 8239]
MKIFYKAINMTLSMFTVIPLPKYEWDDRAAKHIMKLYPFIGLIIGILWYLSFFVLSKLNVPIMLMAALILTVPYILTGFLHLDGFMDVSDALLSKRDKETKLRILKDSTVGAFSVISVVLLLLVEFAGIFTVLNKNLDMRILIFIPIASRTMNGYFIVSQEMLGQSSLAKFFKEGTGKVDEIILLGIYVLVALITFFTLGINYLIAILAMGLISFILLLKVKKELGGINGDVAGYILVLMEFTGILLLGII